MLFYQNKQNFYFLGLIAVLYSDDKSNFLLEITFKFTTKEGGSIAMANTLQLYFPKLRERQQILDDILGRENLKTIYDTWNEQQQNYFLDICCGARGVKMLYDCFFKEILDPDVKPERLEELLSLLLNQRVKILKVLPNDSTRIADESSLLIMDIVV